LPRFLFDLADQEDDAQLRRLMARNIMPSPISLSFRREPSFFDAAKIEGPFHQTIICRDTESREIVGLGTRSIRDRYLNARRDRIGYLSSLRLDDEYRKLGLVARGFQFVRKLDLDDRARAYVTTIVEGNRTAKSTLLGARAGLPNYRRVATWVTYSLSLRRCRWPITSGLSVQTAFESDLPMVVEFLNSHGSHKNFFPHYDAADFLTSQGTFRGLELSRIYIARESGQIVGTFALWDQSEFKQIFVERYSKWINFLRPAYNALARRRGDPILPKLGEALTSCCGSLLIVRDDRCDIAQALLTVASRMHSDKPTRVLLGFDTRCPLAAGVATRASHAYTTGVYLVSWHKPEVELESADRLVYLELGCL
jgi:hypothetical protein